MTDRTKEFRTCVEEKRSLYPPDPKAKGKSRRDVGSNDADAQSGRITAKAYLQEAYIILKHINTLSRMLTLIRRPYLNIDGNEFLALRQAAHTLDLGGDEDALASLKYMSNQERDQVDLQAKTILSRCAEKVKEMEQIERKRVEFASSRTNKLLRMLPSRLTAHDSATIASEFLAAHNSSITWYLNRRLSEVSQSQKEMQEERIKRQLERTRTLGSLSNEARPKNASDPLSAPSELTGGWFRSAKASSSNPPPPLPYSDDEDSDEELELTQSQILQFEDENKALLRDAEDALAAVQQAESRLMEISALQMELVQHLTQQAEITDQLFEDAVQASQTVNAGNAQLVRAKQRQSNSRLYILVFLLGASAALIFLHNY